MKYMFTASKLMKAKEVKEMCKLRDDEDVKISNFQTETRLKSQLGLGQRKKQQAPTLTAQFMNNELINMNYIAL